ncbi:MAG: glycosyl hydrolase family 32 [Acidobacteria bacterium]|nr:glycosyl hydrolase family 32 [Acidobacteriota bacterium]
MYMTRATRMVTALLLCLAPFACAQHTAAPGSATLYNGIRLPEVWPPKDVALSLEPPPPPPYLVTPPAVIPIDVGRQLFVDDFLIEQTTLKRTYHNAEYHPGNPVLKPDRAWERQDTKAWGAVEAVSVFSDGAWFDPKDQLFKLWYRVAYTRATALATSKDGIHWEKPVLDVVPGTNIASNESRGSSTVWMDLEEQDPSRRFKMMSSRSHMQPQRLFFSPDGIHWSQPVAQSIPCGDRTTMFWNPFRKTWVFSIRDGDDPKFGRARRYHENPDIVAGVQWKPGEPVWWMGADRLDPMRPDLKVQPQIYNLDAVAYESLMLGTFAIWRGAPKDRQKPNEVAIGYSRDGFHWTRPVRTAFIPVSEKYGDWNWTNVQPAGGGCLIVGDRLHFYVMGWAGVRDSQQLGVGSIGLATLRRDGFASMDAGATEGALTTRPLSFRGKYLFVNVDSRQGELLAEVVDERGRVIAPFSKRNSLPVKADQTLQQLSWKNGADLSRLAGRTVKLRFYLKQARLYSFWVSPDSTGASHGYVAAGGPGFTGPVDTTGRPPSTN